MFRRLGRRIFPQFFKNLPEETLQKWYDVSKIVYGVSAGTLFYIVYSKQKEHEAEIELKDRDPVLGIPAIKDHNSYYKRLRESGVETAQVWKYDKDKGFIKVDYNREEYLKELEEEALERIRVAQRDWIERHGKLPPNAIKLVD